MVVFLSFDSLKVSTILGLRELHDELKRMSESFLKNMTEKWGEALVSELIPKGVKLMRKPPVEFGDMVEAGISKSLRARQEGEQPWNPLNAKSEDQTIRQSPSS